MKRSMDFKDNWEYLKIFSCRLTFSLCFCVFVFLFICFKEHFDNRDSRKRIRYMERAGDRAGNMVTEQHIYTEDLV